MLPQAAANSGIGLALLEQETRQAAEGTRAYSLSQEQYRKAAIIGVDAMTRAAGALGQIAGMLPSGGGQVGKKRGLFSKILGVAAPFLSFVPVVGPVLSAAAGIASKALAGDYAGALMGAAAGFSAGGAFRHSASAPAPALGDVSTSQGNVGQTVNFSPPRLAKGGPVRRGRAYVVGDRGPRDAWEVFEPEADGYVHASVDAYERSRGGAQGSGHRGGGGFGAMIERLLEAAERQTAAAEQLHAKIEAVPPDHILTSGAKTAAGQRAIFDGHMGHAARDPQAMNRLQRRVAGL
jgi:hypothetical protein